MSMKNCELRLCATSWRRATVRVNENIGDLSYTTWICQLCANALGLKNGDDLPVASIVEKTLRVKP